MFATFFLLAAATAAPTPVEIEAGKDHYFGADHYTSGDYMHLRADGRYVVVDVQHMFTEVADTGRWNVEGRGVVLESEHAQRSIVLYEFRVQMVGGCGQEALPGLRTDLQMLRKRGKPVSPAELDDLQSIRPPGHPTGRGTDKSCGAFLLYIPHAYPAKSVAAVRLDPVIEAIDKWLAAAATQHIFEYQVWKYRGESFLVPMRPGMHAVQSSLEEVHRQMDTDDGARAPYVYYAISAQEFAERAHCTYAFKYYKEMNKPCNEP